MASTTAAAAALGRIASTPNLQAVSSSSTSSPVARLAIGSRSWSASSSPRLRSVASSPLLEVKSRFVFGSASNLLASEHDLASAVAAQVTGANHGRGCRGVVSMAKKSVGDLKESDLKGKRVFVRADLNVPLDENQNITDDTRIRAAVPTIKYLIGNGAKVILASHLGRPKGVTPKYSLKPLVPRLTELLGVNVLKTDDCIGEEVEKAVASLPDGGVLLLENLRFHKEEEKNDPEFAKKLASVADLYVNDAFGTAHRAHASTEGVTKYLKPAVAGFLMQKELDYLVGAVSVPKRPFAAIVGGSKVSSSLVEDDKIELASTLMKKAKEKGVSLLLPTDVVIADKFAADANSKVVPASDIPDGWMGLDIGADSIKTFSEALDTTKTVIWNGPMGVFEFDKFSLGTTSIAKKLAELSGKGVTTIIGGGDSVAAVEKAGLAEKMSHISTGGGASLELLEGKTLPGVLALDDAVPVTV
uniref:Phosphoglycerate kinase n=1 Tax=Picea sitchensis TaxID=3332 RepID=B8LKQ1_PICSI|nr:unknown [Picea sitchensis]